MFHGGRASGKTVAFFDAILEAQEEGKSVHIVGNEQKPETTNRHCPKCHWLGPVEAGGKMPHHFRLRRRRWLTCPGSLDDPKPLPVPLETTTPRGVHFTSVAGRDCVLGHDPDGVPAILDAHTGEVIYRRSTTVKGGTGAPAQ